MTRKEELQAIIQSMIQNTIDSHPWNGTTEQIEELQTMMQDTIQAMMVSNPWNGTPEQIEALQDTMQSLIQALTANVDTQSGDFTPWSESNLHGTFTQIEELLALNNFNAEVTEQVRELIALSRSIHAPQNIDAERLGFFTMHLLRLEDTQNPDLEEINIVISNLFALLQDAFSAENQENSIPHNINVGMVMIDDINLPTDRCKLFDFSSFNHDYLGKIILTAIALYSSEM